MGASREGHHDPDDPRHRHLIHMDHSEALEAAFELVSEDPYLRAVIKAARGYGISPRRFLGWEPKITIREYPGRMIHQSEPEWDEETRAVVLAYEMWERELCTGCGHPYASTTDPENEGRYRVKAPIRCHACTAREIAAEAFAEVPQSSALLFQVDPPSPPPDGPR